MPENSETQSQAAQGFKNVAVSGSGNVAPVMHDTLGLFFLGIISLILLFEVRRLNNLIHKLEGHEGRREHCNCNCKCCKEGVCSCDCCKGEKCDCDCDCDCNCEDKEKIGENIQHAQHRRQHQYE